MVFPAAITIGLSPNAQPDDVRLAAFELIQPWRWFSGTAGHSLKEWFSQAFVTPYVSLANSGRSSFYLLLKAFGIGSGDEVILQAFTCVAVPNSILWLGATPIYCDIGEDYNIDPKILEKHITNKTKAIVVQHTLGIPAKIDEIQNICQKHKILLIEDCAHALGTEYKKKLLGSFGDGAFFSFGRDKVLSSVFGGVAIVNKKHTTVGETLASLEANLRNPPRWWVFQQLFHPIAFALIIPLYTSILGKGLVVVLQKLQLLSFPVYAEEKRGKQPNLFPRAYPNTLAKLAYHQLSKLDRFRKTRMDAVTTYRKYFPELSKLIKDNDVPLLRVPLQVGEPAHLRRTLRKQHMYLGNWYSSAIDPYGVVYSNVQYNPGSCPNAENAAQHILNLPTLVSTAICEQVGEAVQSYL